MSNSLNNLNPLNRLETGIGPITDRVLNTVVDRISSPEFREQLNNKVVAPITNTIYRKSRKYIYTGVVLYAIIIIMLIVIIYLLMKR